MSLKKVTDRVAQKLAGKIKKKDIKTVLDETFTTMADLLLEGDKLNLYGFGTFAMTTRKARMARNPQTGAVIHIPPSKTIRYRISQGFKDKLAEVPVEED